MLLRKAVVVFKIMGKGKGGILIRSLFTCLICKNKCNVLCVTIVTVENNKCYKFYVCICSLVCPAYNSMRHNMFISAISLDVPCFFTLSHKRHNNGKID